MKRLFCLFCVFICSTISSSRGVIVEYELPGVLGDYSYSDSLPSGGYERFDSLIYEGPQAVIRSVSYRYSGSTVSGLIECCIVEPSCPDTSSYPMEGTSTLIRKPGDTGYWWGVGQIYEDGPFQTQGPLATHGGFQTIFSDDIIQIEVLLYPVAVVGMCSTLAYPEGTITEAVLVLDLEYSIPTENQTWGRIKALYNYSH